MLKCSSKDAYEMLQHIVGKPLRYGLKSPDMDLFDMGIGNDVEFRGWKGKMKKVCTYAIHLTCGIKIFWKDGGTVEYYGDTPREEFEKDFQSLVGLPILRIALSDKNDLWIDLGLCRLVIVTFEDGEESWRFFLPGQNKPHLVASNLSLQIDKDEDQ